MMLVDGPQDGSQPKVNVWHRMTHAVLHSIRRFALGPEPGTDVLIFVQ